jgi:hypothetical protein
LGRLWETEAFRPIEGVNSMRRTLLTSLPGKKITSIKLSLSGDMYHFYSEEKLILATAIGWAFDDEGFRFDNSGLEDEQPKAL